MNFFGHLSGDEPDALHVARVADQFRLRLYSGRHLTSKDRLLMFHCALDSPFTASPRRLPRRAGQAGLFIVLNLGLLFGALSLAVDLGWAYYRKQAAQTAADSAALAAAVFAQQNGYSCGANGVVCGNAVNCAYPNTTPATTDIHVGCLYAGANGFYNTGHQTVTIQGNTTAPPGAPGHTPAYWVKATVSEDGYNLFARFASINAFTVSSSAIAGVTFVAPTGCIYVLSSSASSAMSLTGTSAVTSGCGIWINSSAVGALSLTGTSSVHSTQININGGTASLASNAVVIAHAQYQWRPGQRPSCGVAHADVRLL